MGNVATGGGEQSSSRLVCLQQGDSKHVSVLYTNNGYASCCDMAYMHHAHSIPYQ